MTWTISYAGKKIRISDKIYFDGDVQVSGNTKISGTLDMDSNPITNVADPTNSQDAVTLNYLQTNYYDKSTIDGWNLIKNYTLSQDLDANLHRIKNVPYPLDDFEAANKVYVDDAIASKRYYTTVTIPTSSPYQVDITHNLNDPAPIYIVYDDSTGEQIEPQNATVVDNNTLRLEFGSEDAGKTIRVKVIV